MVNVQAMMRIYWIRLRTRGLAFLRTLTLSDGEQCLVLAYLCTGLFGAATAMITVTQLAEAGRMPAQFSLYEQWVIVCGAIGAMSAFGLSGPRFGREGLSGVFSAVRGALWVSIVGSVIAGTLALPLYGTMFGPITLAVILAQSPILALCWFANLIAAHILLRGFRVEQDRYEARFRQVETI